jgi:hypothetical protein
LLIPGNVSVLLLAEEASLVEALSSAELVFVAEEPALSAELVFAVELSSSFWVAEDVLDAFAVEAFVVAAVEAESPPEELLEEDEEVESLLRLR